MEIHSRGNPAVSKVWFVIVFFIAMVVLIGWKSVQTFEAIDADTLKILEE